MILCNTGSPESSIKYAQEIEYNKVLMLGHFKLFFFFQRIKKKHYYDELKSCFIEASLYINKWIC